MEAREHIVSLYRDRGFQAVDVEARTWLDETETRASIGFTIVEGLQTIVDQVILTGLEVTRENGLRSDVTIASRGPLSTEGLIETRQRLWTSEA